MGDQTDQSGNPGQGEEKSLEMRVAELEDRISKMFVSDDDMKAFEKVSRMIPAAGCAEGSVVLNPNQIAINQGPFIWNRIIRPPIRPIIIQECWAECAPGLPGTFDTGGFDQLGF